MYKHNKVIEQKGQLREKQFFLKLRNCSDTRSGSATHGPGGGGNREGGHKKRSKRTGKRILYFFTLTFVSPKTPLALLAHVSSLWFSKRETNAAELFGHSLSIV